jgi:hypothetical protein
MRENNGVFNMSIETDLTRIADALTTIAEAVTKASAERGTATPKEATPKPRKSKKTTDPSPDVVPGTEEQIPGNDGPADSANVIQTTDIKTHNQLRDYAQKFAQKTAALPEKGTAYITFVRGLCAQYNPSNPKLVAMPLDKIPEIAQAIYDWGLDNEVIVE